jgi:hypothetical protein
VIQIVSHDYQLTLGANKRVEEAEMGFPLPALLFLFNHFDISQIMAYN